MVAMAVLLVLVMAMGYSMKRQQESIERYRSNQRHLLEMAYDSLDHYRTRSQDYAVSLAALQLTKDEMERHCKRLSAEIMDLGIQLKRVQDATTTATETRVEIITEVRDSIIYVRDTTGAWQRDSLRYIKWMDPWVTFNGEIRGGMMAAHIESRDTLLQVMHRVPKRFLFIKYGTKEIRQEIKCSNPHTIITYAESIHIR